MTDRDFVILGAAHWHAPWHLRSLDEAGQRVVGASDPSAEARTALNVGRARGDDGDREAITGYDSWQQVLDSHPDAIPIILTPPFRTPPVLERVVAERRPFVLEKPGTVDAAALEPAAEAVGALRIPTLVPLVNRFADFWREVDRTGLRDTWTHAHFRIHAGPPQRYLRDGVPWVLDQESYGGGALRNLGVHATDAAIELTAGSTCGSTRPSARAFDLAVRSAQVSRSMHGLGVEDFAIATLVTSDGRTVTIEAGYTMPAEKAADKEWRVHGPGAAVAESNGIVTVRDATGARTYRGAPSSAQYLAFGRTMAELGRASGGHPVPFAGVPELLEAQRLVDRIYAAAEPLH